MVGSTAQLSSAESAADVDVGIKAALAGITWIDQQGGDSLDLR